MWFRYFFIREARTTENYTCQFYLGFPEVFSCPTSAWEQAKDSTESVLRKFAENTDFVNCCTDGQSKRWRECINTETSTINCTKSTLFSGTFIQTALNFVIRHNLSGIFDFCFMFLKIQPDRRIETNNFSNFWKWPSLKFSKMVPFDRESWKSYQYEFSAVSEVCDSSYHVFSIR